MSELDDALDGFARSLGNIETAEYKGQVYINIDVMRAINEGIAETFGPNHHPEIGDASPEFLKGMLLVMTLYHRIYVGGIARHAADLVPDFVPDGMGDKRDRPNRD